MWHRCSFIPKLLGCRAHIGVSATEVCGHSLQGKDIMNRVSSSSCVN